MRAGILILLLISVAASRAGAEEEEAPRRPLNYFLRGTVLRVQRGRVTLHYDFDDPRQLEDFEDVRPDKLFLKDPQKARIHEGRLRLERFGAIRHKLESTGRIDAQFTLKTWEEGCVGSALFGAKTYTLTTAWDSRFAEDNGLRILAPGHRTVAHASPFALRVQLRPNRDGEMAVGQHDSRAWARVGSLHRQGEVPELPMFRFGLWAHGTVAEIDDLVLTVTPTQAFLDQHHLELTTKAFDPQIKTASVAKLLKIVREAPLSRDARACMKELARRGPKIRAKLGQLGQQIGRKRPYAAVPIIHTLAYGEEADRREALWEMHGKVRKPEFRMAILEGLLPWYPEHADSFHAGLALPLARRLGLFRALVTRKLPDDVVRGCLKDELLARDAYETLRLRGADLTQGDLDVLAKLRAKEGYSVAGARAFSLEFFADRNWALIQALLGQLDAKDPEVAEGAYMLLLSISGKDIAPLKDLWRSWITARQGSYEPPHLGSPGPVAAAILRGRRFLRNDLLKDGLSIWPTSPDWPGTQVGATALSVLALRVAGIPPNDEAIQTAWKATLFHSGGLRGDLEGYTYTLSLLAMVIEAVDRTKHKTLLEAITRRLVRGQLENGQWTYYCKSKEYGGRARPRAGDNSNTQFAILGLRSARRCGVEVPREVWEKTAQFWFSAINPYGGWGYGPKGSYDHEMSMTAAGISTLAICSEALHGPKALKEIQANVRVSSGQIRLGELLLGKGYEAQEIYTLYGVERACILTGTKRFNDFDWYQEGAKILLETQKESGAWGDNSVRGVFTGRGYGEACDTAFALLFLKRATTRLAGSEGGGEVKVPKFRRPALPK
ncbi:MAG: prenyltransferase/squalene oxidase repeat-containing protein [Planctomycetota bacterium]